MLKGVVRQPLSPPLPGGVTTMKNGTAAPAKAASSKDERPPAPRRSSHSHSHQRHRNEGRETILPLVRRPIFARLDVYPFAVGYLLLVLLDAHYYAHLRGVPSVFSDRAHSLLHSAAATVLVDALFVSLLLAQLALFLKCQWDPMWHAWIAYRRYEFRSSSSLLAEDLLEKKMEDMRTWTHCLVVPPNPYAAGDGDGGEKGNNATGRAAAAQTVRPERPGIVPLTLKVTSGGSVSGGVVTSFVATIRFRGWTYRCCCNAKVKSDNGAMEEVRDGADLPMESIWKEGEQGGEDRLEEISDVEDNDEQTTSVGNATSVVATSSWEPQFHRLHFPIDLPLQFYGRWEGHDYVQCHQSHGDSISTTLQSTRQIYGINQTIIPLPPFLSLLTQQLLQPMFLFQLLCVMLWSLDEYWMYAIFTLMTLLLFEAIQAGTRYKNVKRLREEVSGADTDDGGDAGEAPRGPKQKVECYRMGQWTAVPTNELVVGDVISMVSPSMHNRHQKKQQRNAIRGVHDHERGCAVPADLLLLSGRVVVNEAMLTGESVPQVKESIEIGEAIGASSNSDLPSLGLDDGSAHKRCVLFGGTVLMDHHSEREEGDNGNDQSASKIPTPPDQGLVCFVLRTGFDTVQGSLLRTLAYHAESGSGGHSGGGDGVNARETFLFLLLLLVCALASAATVVNHAWGDVTRNHFKLVLHVIIIITSVIPPELPMELSLAVTTSLGELIKRYHVYCTEPFRIPLAGLVDTCCFDKTGTLTSDELRLHGVRVPGADATASDDDGDLVLFDDIKRKSNVIDDGEGDTNSSDVVQSLLPRETLRVMVGCQSLATTHVFVPGPGGRTMVKAELCGDPLEKAVMEACGFTVHPKTELVMEKERLASAKSSSGSIRVLHRFAFSSKLRRMTVIALDTENNDAAIKNNTLWALTKGAPEALRPMLDPESLPADYERSYLQHMTLGRRVLALAYRDLGKNAASHLAKWKSSREEVEQKLTFAGLLVMDSPLKADSARVVRELRGGDQKVVMVTGDAVLTAAEVARRVGIVDASQDCTYELLCPNDNGGKQSVGGRWEGGGEMQLVYRPLDRSVVGDRIAAEGEEELSHVPLSKVEAMARDGGADFCMTGDTVTKLAIQAAGRATNSATVTTAADDRAALNHPAARAALSKIAPLISVFARHAPRHKEAVVAAFNSAGRRTLMCGDGTNDVGALKAAHVGVSIVSVPGLEAKQRSADDAISAVKAEEKRERKKAGKKKKDSKGADAMKAKRNARAERIERSLRALREAEDELDFVGLGNASVASPFTSRKTSVRCCKDILLTGRCTLVTMIQIYKILGVQCLVNALVLTTLHRKGVKQGDRQLTAVGIVVSVLFLFVTRGKPLPKLSPRKPPSSVLSAETLLSMTVQFLIHFLAIMAAAFLSDAYVDPYDPSIVPDGPFHPNTLNTATFLVTVLATINTFLVNYRGRPFMEDLRENKLLYKSIQGCYLVLFACASEVFTPLNQLMQLSPLPSSGPPAYHIRNEGGGSVGHNDAFGAVQDLLLQAVSLVGFRTLLCVIMCLDTALVTVAEKAIRLLLEG